ncbi:MAG: hypothetical protein ACE5HS_15400 [bacterium]
MAHKMDDKKVNTQHFISKNLDIAFATFLIVSGITIQLVEYKIITLEKIHHVLPTIVGVFEKLLNLIGF